MSTAATDTIALDGAAPTGSVAINGGAASTNSTAVTLSLSAADTGGSGLSQMRFSNDGTSWGGWVAYNSTAAWTLAAGDGTRTVYAQYRDAAGNTSAACSDTIVLTITYYTLTYTAGSNGTISGVSPQSVAQSGSGTAVTAVPDAGYRFLAWSDGNLNVTRSDIAYGDAAYSAAFAPAGYYRLAYFANGPGSVGGTTIQAVAPGASGTPVTADYDGTYYQFDGWSDSSLANPRTDTNVNADITVTANFSQWYWPSSCPILFTWDGGAFKYESDLIPGGRLGSTTLNPNDYYVLETTPALRAGKIEMKLVNESVEADYMDQIKLYAIDLPEGRSLASFQQLKGDPYMPIESSVRTVSSNLTRMSAVHVEDGRDISAEVAENHDGRWALLNPDRELPATQTVELDLGDTSNAAAIKLVVEGASWTPDTTSGQALFNAISPAMRTTVQVIGSDGEWQTLSGSWAKPGEFQRSYLLDLTGRFPTNDHRVRLIFSVKTAIDSILLDTSANDIYQATEVPLDSADLRHNGADTVTGDLVPDFTYGLTNPLDMFLTGYYTKFGEVGPLLTSNDDMFAILGSGDELSLTWDASADPPASGITRHYVIYADGYYKYLKRGLAPTVDPLPFAAMSKYPYPDTESYPTDAEHDAYRAEWNTRYED